MKATDAQVEAWKNQYQCRIFEYSTTEDDGKGDVKRAYFRAMSPDMLDVYRREAKMSQLKADMIVINTCWLAGDEEIKTQDEYIIGLQECLGALLVSVEGEMAEL